MCNKDLVRNIILSTQPYHAYKKGGSIEYKLECELKLMPIKAYYNENSIAYIISLGELTDKYKITMDTEDSHSIFVRRKTNQEHFLVQKMDK